jgi:PAS domain S-box-containing protein
MAEPIVTQPDDDRIRALIRELVGTESRLEEALGVGLDAVLDPETGTPIILRRAQAELRLLLEQLPAIAWTVDRDLRYTSVQGTALAALGLRPGDLIGRHLAAAAPIGPLNAQVREAYTRALEGQPSDLVLQHAGQVWQAHLEALRDAHGLVTGVVGVALDTTARARAEAELRRLHAELEEIVQERTRQLQEANEELAVAGEELRIQNDDLLAVRQELEAERQRYRDLFDLAPDGYVVTDLAGTIQEANRAAAALLAMDANSLVGSPLARFVAAPDRQAWSLHLYTLQAGEEDTGPWEMHLQPQGGEPFCASVTGAASAAGSNQAPTSLRWLIRDVTPRKRLEAERDAERARLQAILDSAPEGISVVDAQGKLLFVNRIAEQLHGRPAPIGQSYESHSELMLCYPEGAPYDPRDLPLIRSALHGETLRDIEMDIVWPNGRRRSLLVNTAPVSMPGGTVAGAVGVFRDITALKEAAREREWLLVQAQEARQRSEEQAALLDAVIGSIPIGIFLYDAQGRITRTNAVMDELLGLGPEGKSAPLPERIRTFSVTDTGGRPVRPERAPVARALQGATVQGEIVRWLAGTPDNPDVRWASISAAPVYDGTGRLRGAVATLSDITELRRARDELEQRVAERTLDLRKALEALQVSEERFRELAENIDEVFWLLEAGTNRILYISPGYQKLWGWPATEIYDKPQRVLETIHPEDRDRAIAAWSQGAQNYNQEFRIVLPDGAIRWLRAQTFPVDRGEGQARRVAGVLADITEQKRAQEAVVQMESLLFAARLGASLAHEINNPLQSAVGCLDLAREALVEGEDPSQFLAVVASALDRARSVVTQLRSLHGQPDMEQKQPVEVRSLLERQLLLTEKRSRSVDIEVDLDLDEDLPPLMLMAEGISQVFQHLLLNARDAMPEGGRLWIKGQRTAEPDGVWIRFMDTGMGFPAEMWDHLFEPFQSTKSEGLGLGLFVSQNIVQQHGGRIVIEPRPGGGTTVAVWLPAAQLLLAVESKDA